MKRERVYFYNLDGIRFIAALMVFFSHGVRQVLESASNENYYIKKTLSVLMNGGVGVTIFFVLSGFLITYLLIFEYHFKDRINLFKFYLRRILRIWPLYYMVLIFSFLIYPSLKLLFNLPGTLNSNIYYHLFFLSNFDVINMHNTGISQTEASQTISWSVSIEEQFYLFWPLIFLLPKKIWGLLILTIIVLSFYFRMLHVDEPTIIYYHTLSVIGDLGVGALIAYLISSNDRIRSTFENTTFYFQLLLIIIAILLLFFTEEISNTNWIRHLQRDLLSITFGLFIASQAFTKNLSLLTLSKYKYMTNWGKITYGIYLIHPIAILLLHVVYRRILRNR